MEFIDQLISYPILCQPYAIPPHGLTVHQVSSTSFNENCRKSYSETKSMSENSLKNKDKSIRFGVLKPQNNVLYQCMV